MTEQFREYLQYQPFVVRTDNNPLTYVLTMPNLGDRRAREDGGRNHHAGADASGNWEEVTEFGRLAVGCHPAG